MIAEVETALKAYLKVKMPYLKQVLTYQGDDQHIEDLLEELLAHLPVVTIVYGGAKYERLTKNRYRKHAAFNFLVATQNRRSEEARRHGTDTEEGSYTLLEDLERHLVGKRLGLSITPFEPVDEDSLFTGKLSGRSLSFYGAQYKTSWEVEEVEGDAEDMTSIEGEYTLEGATSPTASDLVDLEEG